MHAVKIPVILRVALRSRQGGSKERSLRAWKQAEEYISHFVSRVNLEMILPFIFASLYWEEGSKGAFVFTNTDARMIKIFLGVLRELFGVKNEDIRMLIRLDGSSDSRACITYWHKYAALPVANIKININSRQNRTKAQYGICRIYLKKGGTMLKRVQCLISAIVSKTENI